MVPRISLKACLTRCLSNLGLFCDARAVGILRLALALFVTNDIIHRLDPRNGLTIEFYCGEPEGVLRDDDTIHHSLLHRLWFFRGPCWLQVVLFTTHFLMAQWVIFQCLVPASAAARTSLRPLCGARSCWVASLLLWLFTVALQGRNEEANDGSDKLLRNSLIWFIFLDYSSSSVHGRYFRGCGWLIESLEVWLRSGRSAPDSADHSCERTSVQLKQHPRSPLPCRTGLQHTAVMGLMLQMIVMYMSVVIDRYHTSWEVWFSPRFAGALHNVLGGVFAMRPLAWKLGSRPYLVYLGTVSTNIVEFFAPLILLLTPAFATGWTAQLRFIAGLSLIGLQTTLLIIMRLPQFSLLSIVITLPFLPFTSVYDFVDRCKSHASLSEMEANEGFSSQDDVSKPPADVKRDARTRYLPSLLVVYMLCLVMSYDLKLFRMPDDGDFGEALRIGQRWVMFSPPPMQATVWTVTGFLTAKGNISMSLPAGPIDVLKALRTGDWSDSEHHPFPLLVNFTMPSSTMYRYNSSFVSEELRYPEPVAPNIAWYAAWSRAGFDQQGCDYIHPLVYADGNSKVPAQARQSATRTSRPICLPVSVLNQRLEYAQHDAQRVVPHDESFTSISQLLQWLQTQPTSWRPLQRALTLSSSEVFPGWRLERFFWNLSRNPWGHRSKAENTPESDSSGAPDRLLGLASQVFCKQWRAANTLPKTQKGMIQRHIRFELRHYTPWHPDWVLLRARAAASAGIVTTDHTSTSSGTQSNPDEFDDIFREILLPSSERGVPLTPGWVPLLLADPELRWSVLASILRSCGKPSGGTAVVKLWDEISEDMLAWIETSPYFQDRMQILAQVQSDGVHPHRTLEAFLAQAEPSWLNVEETITQTHDAFRWRLHNAILKRVGPGCTKDRSIVEYVISTIVYFTRLLASVSAPVQSPVGPATIDAIVSCPEV